MNIEVSSLREIVRPQNTRFRRVLGHGVMDGLMHAGHFRLFDTLRSMGDHVTFAVSPDRMAKLRKNKENDPRPILPQELRARRVDALPQVDAVTMALDPTDDVDLNLFHTTVGIRPDAFITSREPFAERFEDRLADEGIQLEILPELPGISTTDLANHLREHGRDVREASIAQIEEFESRALARAAAKAAGRPIDDTLWPEPATWDNVLHLNRAA